MVVERCGGHITLLFSIWKDAHLARSQGSRGAGFNVATGVEASITYLSTNSPEVEAKISYGEALDIPPGPAQQGGIEITVVDMNGSQLDDASQLYLDLVEELRITRLLNPADAYRIDVQLELPTSQGFGMSAAGLLAVARAFHSLTRKGTEEQYLRIAHRIERKHGSGLGDVLGMSKNGIELRLEPGAPGSGGKVSSFTSIQPILLVWQPDETRHTSVYIDDEAWKRSISKAGERSVSRLKLKPWNFKRWPDLMLESRNFAEASGLLQEPARKNMLSAVRGEILRLDMQSRVNVRLCMLGVSLCIVPRELKQPLQSEELDRLFEAMERIGLGAIETRIQ